MTHEERVARYEAMRREGRLLRNYWLTTDIDGRSRACWLVALSPEVGQVLDPSACPGDVMPPWLAYLTIRLDDNVSGCKWGAFAARCGRCAAGWPALDDAAWSRVEVEVKRTTLTTAREVVTLDAWGVLPAVDAVARLLQEGGSKEEWHTAATAAWDASQAATAAARDASIAADAYAAYGSHSACVARAIAQDALAAARAAVAAATTADIADAEAAADSTSAAAHAHGTETGSSRAAWDRIADALFDAIDREIATAHEGGPA